MKKINKKNLCKKEKTCVYCGKKCMCYPSEIGVCKKCKTIY